MGVSPLSSVRGAAHRGVSWERTARPIRPAPLSLPSLLPWIVAAFCEALLAER